MPTVSVENYLKAIFHLQQRSGGRVKTKEIADRMEISLPSVTSMLKSLSDDAHVEYEKYKGVRLTDEGRLLALQVIRKHRLIELFLVHTLGYTWDEVHAEAERLEHAISDKLAARIEHFLEHPRFDPHGDPIPTADGEIFEHDAIPLDKVEVGACVRVERVLDQDSEVLRYLERVGFIPHISCIVREVLSFDGQMFLELEGAGDDGDDDNDNDVVLSHALASKILVTYVT